MIDIVSSNDGEDMGIYNTQVPKAGNILSVQLASLEYAGSIGIDLSYFLSEDFIFQNASFKSYLIQVLAENGINVTSVLDTVENLYSQYVIQVSPEETSSSLVAR